MSGNGKHQLTVEESSRGGRMKGRAFIKLSRAQMRHEEHMAELRIIESVVGNPAFIGSMLYLGTLGITKIVVPAPTSSIAKAINSNWLTNFLVGGFVKPANGWSIEELQLALLAYIASGGNLAGSFQSGANFLSKLAPALAK